MLGEPRQTSVQSLAPIARNSFAAVSARQRLPEAVISFAAVAILFSAIVMMNGAGLHPHAPRIVAINLTPDMRQPQKSRPKPAPTQRVRLPTIPAPLAKPTPQPVVLAPPVVNMQPEPPTIPAATPAPAGSPVPATDAPASTVQAGDMSARMVAFTAPTYPLDSRRAHEQGTVVLALLLGTDGRVNEIQVSKSSGSARLDDAALSAVRKWRWAPITRDGQPVMVRGTVRIPFQLRDKA